MTIFLDIDGVMVAANSWRKLEILDDNFPAFTPRAIHSFNRILAETKPKIILTTSHKHKYSIEKWKEIFLNRNIKVDQLTRLPENTSNLKRKDELLQYFKENRPDDSFVIIDDDKSLNSLPEKLKDRLVQTSSSVGLTDYLAGEVIEKLKKGNS